MRPAVQPGPAAPQFALPVFSWLNAAGGSLGDDCLSLNVWTPALDGAKRPVLVWIHGGAFLIGSGATPVYHGAALARRGDAVVVTVNYRLGALGFAHLGLLPRLAERGFRGATNLGLRDQIAALEWVSENIDRFGGDPGNVTVFGQSAGGMSVGALLGSPRARGLFHRAICQSGACDHVAGTTEARETAELFLDALGVADPSPASLGEIPLSRVLRAQRDLMVSRADLRNLMVLIPAVDGDLIPRQPLRAIAAGEAARIPILAGSTLEEWKLFRIIDQGLGRFGESDLVERFRDVLEGLPHAPRVESAVRQYRRALDGRSAARSPAEVWSAFQTARIFLQPAHRLCEAQAHGGGHAYHYLFTWRAPAMRRALGACHAIEIPFVFGSTQHPVARPLTGLSRHAGRLSRRMQHSWISFARHGRPGHERLPAWPAYEAERRPTLVLGRSCSLAERPLHAELELLDRWLGDAPVRGAPGPRRTQSPAALKRWTESITPTLA